MDCNRVRQQLNAFLDSELNGNSMLEIRSHLNGCPDCRQALEELRVVQSVMRGLPEIEAPAFSLPQTVTPLARRRRLSLSAALVAAAACALGGAYLTRKQIQPSSPTEVSKVDRKLEQLVDEDQLGYQYSDRLSGSLGVQTTYRPR